MLTAPGMRSAVFFGVCLDIRSWWNCHGLNFTLRLGSVPSAGGSSPWPRLCWLLSGSSRGRARPLCTGHAGLLSAVCCSGRAARQPGSEAAAGTGGPSPQEVAQSAGTTRQPGAEGPDHYSFSYTKQAGGGRLDTAGPQSISQPGIAGSHRVKQGGTRRKEESLGLEGRAEPGCPLQRCPRDKKGHVHRTGAGGPGRDPGSQRQA